MKVSNVSEMGYMLSSGPNPLKRSQEQPQPLVSMKHFAYFVVTLSHHPQLVAHSLSPVADAKMHFSPCVF